MIGCTDKTSLDVGNNKNGTRSFLQELPGAADNPNQEIAMRKPTLLTPAEVKCRATIHKYVDVLGPHFTGHCSCFAVYRDREKSTVEALLVAHGAAIIRGVA